MSLKGWKEKLFQRYMIWSCRPSRVTKHLRSVLPRSRQPEPADRRQIKVAALQIELKLFKNPLQYADEMHRLVREAADQGAQLIVFPEYNNLALFGMLPGIEKMEKEDFREKEAKAGKEGKGGASVQGKGDDLSLADLFRYISPAVKPLVHTIFSQFASAYGLHIMAGSYTLEEKGEIVNRALLYGPSGDLIGSQDKVHPLPMEAEWNLKKAASFNVYETPLGCLAMPVCMDATYYETFRILEESGAEIVLLPIANLEEYNYWLALRGIWPRVQESQVYGIKSALVGSVAGFTFTGRAGIFAPLEITPGQNGVLAEVEPFDREAIALAILNLEALDQLRSNHPWRDSNQQLYKRYFPEIYEGKDH